MKDQYPFGCGFLLVWLGVLLINFAIWGGGIWIVWHFASKYW